MTRVLVTGAEGFLGRHVVAALASRGCEVHALKRNAGESVHAQRGVVVWHTIDLLDAAAVASGLASIRPQGLVHLAWETTPGDYWNSPANETWKDASLELFHDFARVGGTRIVVAGTSAEYAWGSDTVLDERRSPLRPTTLYGSMKNLLRERLEQWAPQAGIRWAWGRVFNIFGPYERPVRLVPKTIRSLLAGERVPFDSGRLVRDFLPVADAADAFAALYASSFSGAVNIASGEGVSIRELLTSIADSMNRGHLLAFGSQADRAGEPPFVVGATEVLREKVGWSGGLGWRRAIGPTCEWWRRSMLTHDPSAR